MQPAVNLSLYRNNFVPDVLEALICDGLDAKSLHALKLSNKQSKRFVENKHRILSILRDPLHLGIQRNDANLTSLEKLQLQFIKFNDRPAWQRIIIVAGLVLISPVILLYHSPKIIKATYENVVTPIAQSLFKNILYPVGRLTYNYILTPVAKATKAIAKALLITMPKALYEHVLVPGAKIISTVANFVYQRIMTPIGQGVRTIYRYTLEPIGIAIKKIITLFFDTINFLYTSVSKYFGGGLKRLVIFLCQRVIFPIIRFTFQQIVVPIFNVLHAVAKVLCFTIPSKICTSLIVPIFEKAIIPFVNLMGTILKGVCVTFPLKVLNSIVLPIIRGVANAVSFIYQTVISPIVQCIQFLGRFTYSNVLSPIGNLIKGIASLIINQLIIPAGQAFALGMHLLYQSVLVPTGILIITLPELFKRLIG